MNLQTNIKSLNEDFNELSATIYGDLLQIVEQIKKQDNQTWRRIYIRTMATAIESQIAYIHSHLKVIKEFDNLPLDKNEEDLLTGKGKRLSFEQRTIFLLNLFSEANYTELRLNTKSINWNKFTSLIKIRNRLTHPKTSRDIDVTLDEVKDCEFAFNKFQETLQVVMEKSGETLVAEAERLRDILSSIEK